MLTSTSDCVGQDSDIIMCTVLLSAMVWGDVLLEQLAMSVGIAEPLALDYVVKVIVYDRLKRNLLQSVLTDSHPMFLYFRWNATSRGALLNASI